MARVYIRLLSNGISELLKSAEMQAEITKAAGEISSRAGDGYEVGNMRIRGDRAAISVYAATSDAIKDNSDNNTLLRSL